MDIKHHEELLIATTGNVDVGKSSLSGVLTHECVLTNISQCLDDGNGKSRQNIFVHEHERKSGRTSCIATHNTSWNSNIIDLCGHYSYLKTTLSGIMKYLPDVGIVCVDRQMKNADKSTKSHINILLCSKTPVIIVFTKSDILRKDSIEHQKAKDVLNKVFTKHKFKMYEIKDEKDLSIVSKNIIPSVYVSSKTGENIHLLIKLCELYRGKRDRFFENTMTIDCIYRNVPNFGTVLCGYSSIDIETKNKLYLGPFDDGNFKEVSVKSLHDNSRNMIDKIPMKTRGCVCITAKEMNKWNIRYGMILTKNFDSYNIKNKFKAKIMMFGQNVTIKEKFKCIINLGTLREEAHIEKIYNDGAMLNVGMTGIVDIVLKRKNIIKEDEIFFLREGHLTCVGIIIQND